jgi:hypothetical protein
MATRSWRSRGTLVAYEDDDVRRPSGGFEANERHKARGDPDRHGDDRVSGPFPLVLIAQFGARQPLVPTLENRAASSPLACTYAGGQPQIHFGRFGWRA